MADPATIPTGAVDAAGAGSLRSWNVISTGNETLAAMSILPDASVLGVGLVLGFKHALEADHLAAIATIASDSRSVRHSSVVGMLWGLGHTLALLAAGVAVMLLHLEISTPVAAAIELGVALMLIGLGANAFREVVRGATLHVHAHAHGGRLHVHPHVHHGTHAPHTHHGVRPGARPLLVGIAHGLAGSGALMLLVLSSIPSTLLGFGYIAVFGVGSMGGMTLMSALVSLPGRVETQHFAWAHTVVRTMAAAFSLAWGMLMAYQIGTGGRL